MNQSSEQPQSSAGKVILSMLPSGIALIQLGSSDERVVTLTPRRLNSLREVLDQIRIQKPRGVIIVGSQANMYTAGADISFIRDVTEPSVGEQLAREGQHIFNQIESLPFPSVAAISGPCVGGGCELAIACTFRLITTDKSSVIGLPEVKLGILPGFGGTQRLPRLIGLPKALDIILGGKIVKPEKALAIGLVDQVVSSPEQLIEHAEALINRSSSYRRKPISFVDRLLSSLAIGRAFVRMQSVKAIARETKGFYPAPEKALDACIYGLKMGLKDGYINEARELGGLIVTPESKALVNLFFLTESAKGLGKSSRKYIENITLGVIGAGVMGAGIGGVALKNGLAVILRDTATEAVSRGLEHIKKYLNGSRSLRDEERSKLLQRLRGDAKDIAILKECAVLVEAVFERLDIKQKVLAEIAAVVSEETLIASNTSSLSITEISKSIKHPERVIGMHFFNPVEKMPLVEIVRGAQTSEAAISLTCSLTTKLGKYPIVVEDVPGFLVNRILTPYLVEAAHLVSEGYMIEDIDRAATRFGMPMGPIRLLDEVGLDVAAHVSEILAQAYGDRMTGPEYAKILVSQKRLGKKNGVGFYRFEGKNTYVSTDNRHVLGIKVPIKHGTLSELTKRLILPLVNEAVRCFDEGVAGTPCKEAAQQIDLGSVMGFGFPPFRGGLLHYANSLGAKVIAAELTEFAQKYGARFTPCSGIIKRSQSGDSFYTAL